MDFEKMLYTNLKHIETAAEWVQATAGSESMVLFCGRMDSESIRLYRVAEKLEKEFAQVRFFDLEADNPDTFRFVAEIVATEERQLPMALLFRNGEVIGTIPGTGDEELVKQHLLTQFGRNLQTTKI